MQTIYLDISNKGVIPTIYAKQGDVGRKFLGVFTNSGIPYNLEDAILSVWYDGDSGNGNYTKIGEKSAFEIDGNCVIVEMIAQMLSVSGDGVMCLVLSDDKQQIGSWNIPYICEEKPGADSDEAKEYYNAFSEIVDAAKKFTTDTTLSVGGRPADAAETGRQLSVERARIDNLSTLKEGSTTGDAELIDIRVGYNGSSYNSAGNAVRSQFSKTFSSLDELEDALYGDRINVRNAFNKYDPDIVDGRFINGSTTDEETWQTNKNFIESGYIPVTGEYMFRYKTDAKSYTVSSAVAYYDGDKELLVVQPGGSDRGYNRVPHDTYTGIAYARCPIEKARIDKTMVFFTDTPDVVETTDPSYEPVPFDSTIFTYGGNQSGIAQKVDEIIAKIYKLNHWNGKQWYAYGTSLTSVKQGKYVDFVADFSGLIATNKGIPGGGIVNNTYVKEAVMNKTDGKLGADLITLEVGANDTTAILGTIYDTGDDTFCGALNQCIRYLQENTTAQVVVISSTHSNVNEPEHTYGSDNHTKLEQRKATEDVCKLNGVPYIPMGEYSGLGYTRMTELYTTDGTHHTELGGYNLAQFVWSRLKDIPLWYTEIPT